MPSCDPTDADDLTRGTYRIDIHEGRGITFRYLDRREDRMTADADGKVVWSRGRWRPPRVMVNCNQMGEAAGRSAAKAVREGLSADRAFVG